MKLKLQKALMLAVLIALPVLAEEHGTPVVPSGPPDKEKISYALGMRLGLQRKQSKSDLDINNFCQGLKDALEDKPTQIKETEIRSVMKEAQARGTNITAQEKLKLAYASGLGIGLQLKKSGADLSADTIKQAINDVAEGKPTKVQESEIIGLLMKGQEAAATKMGATHKIEGEAFLAKNAKEPDIKILPDGLQYRILNEGTGSILTTNDHIFLKWKGSFLNGKEFEHHNHFPTTPGGGFQCWQDALQRMKVGAKWQIFSPPALAFGHEGEPHYNVPPDSTVIFELEVRELVKADDPRLGQGRLGHGVDGRDDP